MPRRLPLNATKEGRETVVIDRKGGLMGDANLKEDVEVTRRGEAVSGGVQMNETRQIGLLIGGISILLFHGDEDITEIRAEV